MFAELDPLWLVVGLVILSTARLAWVIVKLQDAACTHVGVFGATKRAKPEAPRQRTSDVVRLAGWRARRRAARS